VGPKRGGGRESPSSRERVGGVSSMIGRGGEGARGGLGGRRNPREKKGRNIPLWGGVREKKMGGWGGGGPFPHWGDKVLKLEKGELSKEVGAKEELS